MQIRLNKVEAIIKKTEDDEEDLLEDVFPLTSEEDLRAWEAALKTTPEMKAAFVSYNTHGKYLEIRDKWSIVTPDSLIRHAVVRD